MASSFWSTKPIPGREEYLNSEKYEIKIRDWNAPGNIKRYIAALNKARRANPALLQTRNLRFLPVDNDHVVAFTKQSIDASNTIVGAIALSRDACEVLASAGSISDSGRQRIEFSGRAGKPHDRRASRRRVGRRTLEDRSVTRSALLFRCLA